MSNTSETPNPYSLEMMKLENKVDALDTAIKVCLSQNMDYTALELIQIRDDFKQKLKDLQIDANALPFPEK